MGIMNLEPKIYGKEWVPLVPSDLFTKWDTVPFIRHLCNIVFHSLVNFQIPL